MEDTHNDLTIEKLAQKVIQRRMTVANATSAVRSLFDLANSNTITKQKVD